MRKQILSIILLIFILQSAGICNAGVAVIVNQSVPEESLSAKRVRDIFLGHVTRWGNGKKIVIVIQKEGNSHIFFTRKVLGIAPEKLARLWKRAFFAGNGNLPKICRTEERVVELVQKYPGAIGYISDAANYPGVKSFKLNE